MSRVAKKPIQIPAQVSVLMTASQVVVKGPQGELSHTLHRDVRVTQKDQALYCTAEQSVRGENQAKFAGTTRAILSNMVHGVVTPFEKKLQLIGVGYRAAVEGKKITLMLGFSHPCLYQVPQDVEVSCPMPTEIQIKGLNKQRVGQIAADIRSFRPPEPYKGKGIRYQGEVVLIKEAKKK